MPLISVVVPVHNVEAYLDECLASIQQQTLGDLEVILVDDASEDRSREIARRYVEADPRFRLIELEENAGQGRARNLGIELATGTFLTFVDGDDVVVPDAYERLVSTMTRTGSDVAAGNVQRLTPTGAYMSGMHADAFAADRFATHITEHTKLIRDTCVWNKVYRLDFWRRHGLAFAEGVVFEDMLVAIQAHVLARSVDVHTAAVYEWRERAEGTSTTQQRLSIENLLQRLDALTSIREFLDGPELADVRREHDFKVLDNDLLLALGALPVANEIYGWTAVHAVRDYLEDVDPVLLPRLRAIHRLQYHLVGRGLLRELLTVLRFESQELANVPRIVQDGRVYGNYPFRGDPELAVPDEVYVLDRELELVTRVEDVSWVSPTEIEIAASAFIVGVESGPNDTVAVRLVDSRDPGREVPARTQLEDRPDVSAQTHDPLAEHLWSGLRAVVDVTELLRDRPALRTDDWTIEVEVVAQGVRRRDVLRRPNPGRASRPPFGDAEVARVNPYVTTAGELRVMVHTPHVLVDRVAVVDGTVHVGGEVAAGKRPTHVRAVRRSDGAQVVGTVQLLPDWRFEAAFTPLPCPAAPEDAEPAVVDSWGITLETRGGQSLSVHVDPDTVPRPVVEDASATAVGHTSTGLLVATVSAGHLSVDTVALVDDRLTVTGTCIGVGAGVLRLGLRGQRLGDVVAVAASRDGVGFTATLPTVDGAGRPLASDLLTVTAELEPAGAPPRPVAVEVPHYALGGFPVKSCGSLVHLVAAVAGDRLMLNVNPPLADDERGPANQARLAEHFYPAARALPLEHAVIFESWAGKYAACNPRGIQEELRAQGHDAVHYWVVRDFAVPVPDGTEPVVKWSRRYYELMARARWVVANDTLPDFFDKRDGQTYLQTWHGTPLKRLSFDLPTITPARARYLQWFSQDAAQWDYLLSPNAYSTEIFRRGFRYGGEILETGYPRNDAFRSPDADARAAALRARLGIADDATVVLYAPTWRDNVSYGPGRYKLQNLLDFRALKERFGDSVVVLFRGHHLVVDALAKAGDDVLDLSRYPDIQDLYLIADVLITDYSSVMFDFAVTGRPMLFFTYDLENYRDELRGFYFDFESEAPGPLLRTSDEILSALADLPALEAEYAERYAAFCERFVSLEDGKAAARVIDRVFP